MLNETLNSRLKIQTDIDKKTIYVAILADVEGINYSAEWLEQQLVHQGYSWLRVISSVHNEIAERLSKNDSARINLGQLVDAKVKVVVSIDMLSASLHITSAKGGNDIASADVLNALNDKKIDLSLVNKKRIVGLVRKSKVIEPGETIEVIVARGIPPKQGVDTSFKCLLENTTDRKPQVRDDGTLDYYDLGEILCVDEGCQLMRKYPPKPAIMGRSVTGLELNARKHKTFNFKKGKGTQVSPTDPDVLISSIKGQPIIRERGVAIDKIYRVKNVDLRTGHIDYDGTVIVHGDVVSGMKIKVTGDIQIFGMVENACIESDGNIDIKLGAVGRTGDTVTENRMEISCKGNLSASYLENVDVNVQGNVLVKSRISNCELKAGEQVIVGNRDQEKSGIVGGHVSAGSMIRTEVLGSPGCALTHVELAYKTDVFEQLEGIKKTIVMYNELLMSKLGVMMKLSKKQTEEAKQSLNMLKEETEEIKKKTKELIRQQVEIEQDLGVVSLSKIIVRKESYPGVTIKIKDKELKIKSECGLGEFFLLNGEIQNTSLK